MAIQHVHEVIDRLTEDKAFRMKYCKDPDSTLGAYLNMEEIRAIKTGDGHSLTRMGCGEKFGDLTAALCGENPGP